MPKLFGIKINYIAWGRARTLYSRPKLIAKLSLKFSVRVTRQLLGSRDAPSLEVALAFLDKGLQIQPRDKTGNEKEIKNIEN